MPHDIDGDAPYVTCEKASHTLSNATRSPDAMAVVVSAATLYHAMTVFENIPFRVDGCAGRYFRPLTMNRFMQVTSGFRAVLQAICHLKPLLHPVPTTSVLQGSRGWRLDTSRDTGRAVAAPGIDADFYKAAF